MLRQMHFRHHKKQIFNLSYSLISKLDFILPYISSNSNYRLADFLTVVMTALLRGSPLVCSRLHESHTNLHYNLTLWVRPTFCQPKHV